MAANSQYLKDPDAVLDYEFDWSVWLAAGETIASKTVTVTGVTLDSSPNDDTSVIAWVSGGTAGAVARVACRITTSAGRTDERSIRLRIIER